MSARRLLLPAAALLFGLTACGGTPAAAPPASNSGTGAAPAVTTPAATPAVTSSPAVTSKPTSAATKKPHPAATKTTAGVSCPSAKTLEKVARALPEEEALPKDSRFVQVRCWKDWATADPKGPNPGDGFYLFHYKAGAGWKYHSQGSGYHCEDIGIHERAPFCQYPG